MRACSLHLVESLGVARVWYLFFHGAQFLLELLCFFLKLFFFQSGLQESKKSSKNSSDLNKVHS